MMGGMVWGGKEAGEEGCQSEQDLTSVVTQRPLARSQ